MNPLMIHAQPRGLRRPVLITAFTGWNDAAEAATTAARYLATTFHAEKFAEIDPEEFYHFGLTRPYVRFKPGSETEREIVWPATEFSVARAPELSRDLVIAVAGEPLLNVEADLTDLEDATRQFEQNLAEIVAQNAKIKAYVAKLESRDAAEAAEAEPAASDLPPASELVEEIEQFLRQQRPE